jgi:hypothetical protein
MDRRLILFLALILGTFGCLPNPSSPKGILGYSKPIPVTATYGVNSPNIRLLCIKHSREFMADGDANLAIQAANSAKAEGLNIKVVGNYFVDGRLIATNPSVERIYNVETLTQYINQYIKTDAKTGDTLIIFTIGHGFPGGSLHNIGERSEVLSVLATAAEKNNQKIFWWQLSCHASAGLPEISSLNPRQQELVSMFASSSAQEQSAAYVQGKIMAKIFDAMAKKSNLIDPNGDGKITADELRKFMNTIDPSYGNRIHAKNSNTVIFGSGGVPWLPIVDRNGPQGQYPEDYVFPPQ